MRNCEQIRKSGKSSQAVGLVQNLSKALPSGVWTLTLFPEDEPPPYPVMFCRPPHRDGGVLSWARSGATFLVSSRRIGWQGLRPRRGGVFLHIHKFAKPQKEGGTSGTQNVGFCDLRTCGSLAPKKKDGKFANAQFTNRNCRNLGHPNQRRNEFFLPGKNHKSKMITVGFT